MKSRLIKFACHHCGTKLAVPPEMAGVTDQCPKCGTTITAPPESTLEPVRRKSKFAPVPKSEHEHEHQPQPRPEMPTLPGWSASELADALRPPAPLASYTPPAPPPEREPLPDPPAIPDPGPLFVPKRKAHAEGAVAIAPPPPVAAKNEHPVLGSILDAPTLPRARSSPSPVAAPSLPDPFMAPVLPQPQPQPQVEVEMPPAPAVETGPGEPAVEAAIPPPIPAVAETPAPAEMPEGSSVPPIPPAEISGPVEPVPTEAASPSHEALPEPQGQLQESPAAPEVKSSPIALVPESLPDARAVEDAAMPGMGEMLAGGQIAQDPAAPPDTRDHRPLLHVPFLPVAESPAKGRRSQKRKLYILGVILFLVIDAVLIDAVLLHWFFKVPPGALSGEDVATNVEAPAASSDSGSEAAAGPSATTIGTPSEFTATPSESSEPVKPATPPMAIPLPGHSSGTHVPTATPIPASEPAAPAAASSPAPDATAMKPEPTVANALQNPPPATPPLPNPVPATSATPPPAGTPAAASSPLAAPGSPYAPDPRGGTTPSAAALMGPQPAPPTTISEADPPWLKRISPTFPAIDGTPLLPAASDSSPVAGPPPPLPQPPGPPAGTAPTVPQNTDPAQSQNPSPNPATATPMTDAAALSAAPAPSPTTPEPPPENPSIQISKVPEEAQSAMTVLRNFLAARTWQERAAYVQKPDLVKPAMEKHAARYGDGPVTPATIKFVDRHPGRDGGPPYCMFEIDGGDLKHDVLVLVEQPQQGPPRVDWATFVEFKDDLLLKFLETKGEPNQTFRVLLSRKHYFAKDVPDLAAKDSFQVQQPNDRFDGHVFLPKSSALSKKLATQLGWNQNMPVIVELAWRTNGKLHWVEIVRIVSYGWRG